MLVAVAEVLEMSKAQETGGHPGHHGGGFDGLAAHLGASEPVTHSARVVGMPRPCMASEHRNSRIELRSTARPSPMREYGVRPAPLSCNSKADPPGISISPSKMARPSPSWPAHCPNWWPLYTLASGCEPGQACGCRSAPASASSIAHPALPGPVRRPGGWFPPNTDLAAAWVASG
jgi:hypothetical protein